MASNDETLQMIDHKLTVVHKELITLRNLQATQQENLDSTAISIGIAEERIRDLEGTKYLLESQPAQEVHAHE